MDVKKFFYNVNIPEFDMLMNNVNLSVLLWRSVFWGKGWGGGGGAWVIIYKCPGVCKETSTCYGFWLDCSFSVVPASTGGPPLLPPPFFFLSWTDELAKDGTCAYDRRALKQFALNVHVKHSDLT